jgi:hypothetical protein
MDDSSNDTKKMKEIRWLCTLPLHDLWMNLLLGLTWVTESEMLKTSSN